MILGIIKRIMDSWASTLTAADLQMVDNYLDDPGKFLFFQMDLIDQLHSLSVARMIIKDSQPVAKHEEQLIKAALLHDVGKVKGDFNFMTRIVVGIIRRVFPIIRGKLAKTQPKSYLDRIRYSIYVDLIHPARGAHMARVFGIEPTVVEMIRRHHDPPRPNQSPELTRLQYADNRN